jgi:hypothetical protein
MQIEITPCVHPALGAADRGKHRKIAGAIEPRSDVGSAMIQNAARRRLSRSDYALV